MKRGMKTSSCVPFFWLFVIFLSTISYVLNAQSTGVGINTTGAAPDNSAILDVSATDKGILIPRVSLTDVTSGSPITSPATGLMVYNTNASVTGGFGVGFYYWSGTSWVKVATGNPVQSDLTDGRIWVGDAANQPVERLMSGDATLSNTGVLDLANDAVETSEIQNGAVTYGKIQNVSANRLLGNPTGSAAAPAEIILGSGLSFSGSTLNTVNNGTVTSVGLSMPGGFTVTGSPVTGSGTLTVSTTLSGPIRGTGSAFTTGPTNLASEVTGILPVSNGGTGVSSIPANGVVVGNGTSPVTTVAPGASGNVLVSNGTSWTSGDASGSFIRNQNTVDQTANFRITGTGRANTSFQSPVYTRADAGTVAIRPFSNSTTAIQLQNAGGTGILNVDATNGRVGIGTTAPFTPLTIAHEASYTFPNPGSAATGAINVRMNTSGRQTGITFSQAGTDNAQAGIYVHQDNSNGTHIYLATTNSYATGPQTRVTILNNGNVGIGTTAPTQRLDVQGGNARINNVFIGDVGHGSAWAGFSHSNMATTTGYGVLQSSDGAVTLINKQNTGSGYIGFRVGNADQAVILNNGNVGIGTTAPVERFDVIGSGWFNSALRVGSAAPNSGAGSVSVYGSGTGFQGMLRMFNNTTGTLSSDGGVVGMIGSRLHISNLEADTLFFSTANTVRMFITGTGQAAITEANVAGTALTVDEFNNGTGVLLNERGNGSALMINQSAGESFATSNGYGIIMVSTGTLEPIRVDHNGNVATLSTAGVWTNASDSTLKKNIRDIGYGLSEVMALRPVAYEMKSNGEKQIGFIAQEIELIIPEVVERDAENGKYSMSYGNLTALLAKAIQQQQKLIESQQNEIENLKSEVAGLKSGLKDLDDLKAEMDRLKFIIFSQSAR